MIVLDTNIISSLMRTEPETRIISWLDQQTEPSVWVTAVSIFELRYGIEILPESSRRRQLEREFTRVIGTDLENRILPLDDNAAAAAASIAAQRKQSGRPVEIRDTLIAGIVVSRRADFATRNVRDFQDLDIRVIDPWGD